MATQKINAPDLGGAADVDVIEVLVKVGDKIALDTPLLTLESDKATMEVPSSDVGVVKEVLVNVGDKISTGSPILVIESEAQTVAEKAAPADEKKPVSPDVSPKSSTTAQPAEKPAEKKPEKTTPQDNGTIHAGPAVRRIAREFGVNLEEVKSTGPKSRILKEDIQAYVKEKISNANGAQSGNIGLPSAPSVDFAKFGEIEKQNLSRIKKLSGKNLHRNWLLVPHVTQFGEADISEMEQFRGAQKEKLDKQGVKLTPLVFIMKAVVAALKAFPQFNASLDASGEQLILKKYFHIGVAVDTPDGLVVPVVRDVDQKGLQQLAKELSALSEKARLKQLTANDMQGGCFSISSLGGIGGTAFTPIVNVPEVAILGVSKASIKPVFEGDAFVPKLMLPLSLSYDHRVIDGADGARFMVTLCGLLSDIRNLLL